MPLATVPLVTSSPLSSEPPCSFSPLSSQLGAVVMSEAVVRCIWELNMLQGGFESLFSFLADNLGT